MDAGPANGGVDVWLAWASEVDASSLERWSAWLTPDEQRKCHRFVTEALRREYLVTRALSRWALSYYAPGVAPCEWRFERTAAGRPFAVSPVPTPEFNLTNADGLVACAVSKHPVGVDVEPLSRSAQLLETADYVFSESEDVDLRALDEDRRAARAVELWTLKEAYLKARGEGISEHLNRLGLSPIGHAEDARRFCLATETKDAADWQLEVRDLSAPGRERYMLAVAVRRERGADVLISCAQGMIPALY